MRNLLTALRSWLAKPHLSSTGMKALIIGPIGAALVVPLLLVAVPYIDFFNDMALQYKVRPQMTWQVVDGEPVAFDRDYPEGTVPREELPYPFTDNSPEALPEALAWLMRTEPPPPAPFHSPPMTLELMERGEQVYQNVCITCHGQAAFGNGRITRLGFPAPPSLHTPAARALPAAHVFHQITLGQNTMPSHAWQVPPEDRWAVAAYLEALQHAYHPGPEEETEEETATPDATDEEDDAMTPDAGVEADGSVTPEPGVRADDSETPDAGGDDGDALIPNVTIEENALAAPDATVEENDSVTPDAAVEEDAS